ncbi:DUF6436 domain-containing protein [Comamonadaceae bacterium PP-2]
MAGLVASSAAFALWNYFGAGGLQDYAEQAVVFDDASLRLPAELAGNTGRIRLVHFWDPECVSCNRETAAHLNYLIDMYRRRGIDFYSVRKPGTHGDLPGFLAGKTRPLVAIEGMDKLPASPAVALWDRQGRLAYAGPYSPGLVCSSANSFVEPLIDRLVEGQTIEPIGMLAVGCYCRWKD